LMHCDRQTMRSVRICVQWMAISTALQSLRFGWLGIIPFILMDRISVTCKKLLFVVRAWVKFLSIHIDTSLLEYYLISNWSHVPINTMVYILAPDWIISLFTPLRISDNFAG